MSTAFAPDVGEVQLLKFLLNFEAPSNPILHLYKAPSGAVSESTVLADLTESDEAGYAPITLTGSNWSVATAAGVTTATHPQVTFTFTTSATAYGLYVTDASSRLLWMEKFDGSGFTLPGSGGEIAIDPTVTLA